MLFKIFAIDPSCRACGWARLDYSKKELLAGTCKSRVVNYNKAIIEIYNELLRYVPDSWFSVFIIERPIINDEWTGIRKERVKKLRRAYDLYSTFSSLLLTNAVLWTPTVPEWKGQLSKLLSHKRAYATLEKAGITIVSKNIDHNAKDAIAMIAKYLIKEGYIEG